MDLRGGDQPRFRGRGERVLRDSTEPQAAVFIDDVLRRNRRSSRLQVADLDHPTERIVWIGPAELPTTDQPDSARWRVLARREPPIQRIWILTRPAYDASRTRAYVIQQELCAPEAAAPLFPSPHNVGVAPARWPMETVAGTDNSAGLGVIEWEVGTRGQVSVAAAP